MGRRAGCARHSPHAGYLAALLATGAAAHLRDLPAARALHWWLAVPSTLLILGAGHQILALPVSRLGGFWPPRRYGLHRQRLVSWLWDRAKGGLIGAGRATAATLTS